MTIWICRPDVSGSANGAAPVDIGELNPCWRNWAPMICPGAVRRGAVHLRMGVRRLRAGTLCPDEQALIKEAD